MNTGFVDTVPKPVCRIQSGREAANPVTGQKEFDIAIVKAALADSGIGFAAYGLSP
ncbi:MAG: hypothetical protein ABIQ31_07685 [Ferruginibacter sp.]